MTNARTPASRFVIVGNGVAGMEAALVLRAQRPDATITIVSEESDHHFSRTALMWIHAGQLSHRDTEPFERDVYRAQRFVRVRARAVGIDVAARRLLLAGGLAPLPYDALLLATGSIPRPLPFPGEALVGVGAFVTHQDLAWYEEELFGRPNREPPPNERAHLDATTEDSPYRFRKPASASHGRTSRTPAIIGGGLIGLEAVELALARGLSPHLFYRDAWFWPMGLSSNEAGFVARRLERHGAVLHANASIERLVGDAEGRVAAVRADGRDHVCDCVVAAIGVQPNTRWLGDDVLERDPSGGIVVDSALRTNAADVFAAGDCASIPRGEGTHGTELLWYTGRDQGRIVARAMLGEDVRYAPSLGYNSAKVADLELTSVGRVHADPHRTDEWFYEEPGPVESTTRVLVEDGRVVGMNLIGRRYDHEPLLAHIREGGSLDFVLEHLTEAAFDTELVPPLRIPEEARRRAPSRTDTRMR